MTARITSPRSVLVSLLLALPSLQVLGCAAPLKLTTASHVVAPSQTESIDAQSDSVIVQVRYFSFSPTVSVLAWNRESDYGLRAWIRRDGSLVGHHQIYVSTYRHPSLRSLPWASIPSRPLFTTGISGDNYACYFGKPCSPFETFGAIIRDEVLRPTRDNIPVTFYGYDGSQMIVTLNRDLIAAYLTAIDSVSTELRRSN